MFSHEGIGRQRPIERVDRAHDVVLGEERRPVVDERRPQPRGDQGAEAFGALLEVHVLVWRSIVPATSKR
jgi:hypothetical protein